MPRVLINQKPVQLRNGPDGYPDDREQLGALWEIIAANPGLKIPASAAPIFDQVKAAKVRFPKAGRKPKP